MADYLEQILDERKIAFAIFDRDLILRKSSENFNKIIHVNYVKKNSPIWDIFPELIGSEDQVSVVLYDQQKNYKIEKINVFSASGKLYYYDLTLVPLKDHSYQLPALLCIVDDKTTETSMEQEIQQQKYEIELLRASLTSYGNYQTGGILGESEKIKEVQKFIDKIASIRNTTILLQGDSGTGKNLVARTIHKASMAPDSPFVEINCASMPATLIESEIFGYEKGAFTNAISVKKGLLEEANNGTLFLDEIGELPMSLQAKFLSFLETKTFRRLGSTIEKTVNIRVMAATNKDLKIAVDNKEFRPDLYYRLNVVTIKLPPLIELRDDIIIIAENFVNTFAFDFRKKVKGLSEAAKSKLLRYHWPGNVRELRNIIERAVIFAEGDKIDTDDIILVEDKEKLPPNALTGFTIPKEGISLNEVERKLLIEALSVAKGNQSKAARLLSLTLDTFRYRCKKYNIN